jgi:hypothetical protein
MRDRRALVAGDIADAAFEQGLGDREDAFAAKFLAGAELQVFHLARERAFCHARLLRPRRELRTTEYNFRHQTKMMSIGLAGLTLAKALRVIYAHFAACFVGLMHSRRLGPEPARLTGYFSHETLLERVALGGVRQGGLCGRLT